MGLLDFWLKKFLGSKSDRDIKEVQPYLEKIRVEYDRMKNLSVDELRNESSKLRTYIRDAFKAQEAEIADLKTK